MRILENLFGPHADHLQMAMSKTAERQRLLAGNIANVNTPGYKRKDIDFNIELTKVERKISLDNNKLSYSRGNTMSRQQPAITGMDENSVDMEFEVMATADTELRYQALADLTSRYFSGMKNVIREGR